MAGDPLFGLDAFRAWEARHFSDEGDSEDEQEPIPMPMPNAVPVPVEGNLRQLAQEYFAANTMLQFLRINSFYYFLVALVHYILRHFT